MSEDYNKILSKNIKHQLSINNMSQYELSKKLNVSAQSVSNWINGIKAPRMDKVDAMCKVFACERLDLISINKVPTELKLTEKEEEIILRYRNADDITREMVHRSLGMKEE